MQQILRKIGQISRCFETISNIEFKELDLGKGQYLYLVRINENPGIIQGELAELLNIDRTSVAKSIKKLETDGWIVKRESPINKKERQLFPTDKGKEIYSFLKRENDYSSEVALRGFDEEEKIILLSMLERMKKNIEPDWQVVKRGIKRDY
ncbi:MarR family transcriptional regulator [Paenibacillus ferrarius]|uniref:MarR family transcriptional regulator n=1 Tax=Paenibacillus ferrarius TaxID=1469647 RepID=A0A1V4HI90_9BACL|nr:MarR family transcriptional regulator [Paenibacillus ferrarius]OPH56015.1 MarR family transcriptional regulator [Paenibacillus ferrarius]